MDKEKISILSGFLFIINIIMGTGIFLNTVPLYALLGGMSFIAYILTGLLMIPIIFATYMLAARHPGYNMSQLLIFYFGDSSFILVPLYVLSKLSTSVIGILFISYLIQKTFLYNIDISIIYIIFIIFLLFFLVILLNISLHPLLQKMTIFLKLIPIFLVLGYCFYIYFFNNNVNYICNIGFLKHSFDCYKLAQGASITIFAFAGFESLFAISNILQNKKRAFALLFFSFFIAMIIYVLYQFAISYLVFCSQYQVMGGELLSHFLEICFQDCYFRSFFIFCINIAIMGSSFGVSQGILYLSVRNIYNSIGSLFYNKELIVKYFIFVCVLFYLYLGYKNIFILQQLSSLGTLILYLLFILCFYKNFKYKLIGFLGFFSLFIFFIAHFYNAIYYFGFTGYLIYGILLIILLILYFFRKVKNYDF